MKSRLTLVLVASLALASSGKLALAQSSPDDKAAASTDPGADKLVEQLGADDYQKREEAQRKLVALGRKALPSLEKAERESKDAEVRARAHEAIATITKGSAVPDAPPAREKKGELEPNEPKLDEGDQDQPPRGFRPPRLREFFRGPGADPEIPEALQKMLEQLQKQFESLDHEAEREMRRPLRDQGTVRTQVTIRPKTPIELRLGVALVPPPPALATQLDLGTDGGLLIDELTPNLPAWRSGLQRYDVVVAVDGKPVRNPGDLADLGTREAKVDVIRKAKRETILVHPGTAAPAPAPGPEKPADPAPKSDERVRKF